MNWRATVWLVRFGNMKTERQEHALDLHSCLPIYLKLLVVKEGFYSVDDRANQN